MLDTSDIMGVVDMQKLRLIASSGMSVFSCLMQTHVHQRRLLITRYSQTQVYLTALRGYVQGYGSAWCLLNPFENQKAGGLIRS